MIWSECVSYFFVSAKILMFDGRNFHDENLNYMQAGE